MTCFRIITTIAAIVMIAIMASCAKQGYPSGGPRDTTPPSIVQTTPLSGTLNFGARNIVITFDEYITLKDATKNIFVSPPLKTTYSVKGRNFTIAIPDSLPQNTTYRLIIDGAIADNNEGNLLPTVEYLFSTGSYIDSFEVSGTVIDAFTAAPHKDRALVAIYDISMLDSLHTLDSLAMKTKPSYAARCDNEGKFTMRNIPQGQYNLMAFIDANNNLLLDANETLTFCDSAVNSQPMSRTTVGNDSSATDTLSTTQSIHMRLFEPNITQQRIVARNMLMPGKAQIVTAAPMQQPTVAALGTETIHTLNSKRDTLTVWDTKRPADTLTLIIKDSLIMPDTITLVYQKVKNSESSGLGASQATNKTHNSLRTNIGSRFHYFERATLLFPTPIAPRNDSSPVVDIYNLTDSSQHIAPLSFDSLRLTAHIDFDFKSGHTYRIHLAQGALNNIYGKACDSLLIQTATTRPENYGHIVVDIDADHSTIEDSDGQYIVQLLNERDVIIKDTIIQLPARATFRNLQPGTYKIKAIADSDKNGQWTTGELRQRRQPELVFLYGKRLELRANWTIEEKWTITKTPEQTTNR